MSKCVHVGLGSVRRADLVAHFLEDGHYERMIEEWQRGRGRKEGEAAKEAGVRRRGEVRGNDRKDEGGRREGSGRGSG